MNLFDETESKYYELITVLLSTKGTFSVKDMQKYADKYLSGELDFEVMEALFDAPRGDELIFTREGNTLHPVFETDFPIRNSILESQAARSMLSQSNIRDFLSDNTIEKLNDATTDIETKWAPEDITIKNLFERDDSNSHDSLNGNLSLIIKAIREKAGIKYDNQRPGYVALKNCMSYPVKIEFSIVNNRFRVCAYEPKEKRFIKINLDSMENIEVLDEYSEIVLGAEYRKYIKNNLTKVVLDVEPIDHVVERCFRVFSHYSRKARYDKTDNKYRLEVLYIKADESEIIKNILSLGSYVVVMEPRTMQKEIYSRLLKAKSLYKD